MRDIISTSQLGSSSAAPQEGELGDRGAGDFIDAVSGISNSGSKYGSLTLAHLLEAPPATEPMALSVEKLVGPRGSRARSEKSVQPKNMMLPSSRAIVLLSPQEQSRLLSSISEVKKPVERPEMIQSEATHYHVMDPDENIYHVPAPANGQKRDYGGLEGIKWSDMIRLDNLWRRHHDSDYVKSQNQKKRLRRRGEFEAPLHREGLC